MPTGTFGGFPFDPEVYGSFVDFFSYMNQWTGLVKSLISCNIIHFRTFFP